MKPKNFSGGHLTRDQKAAGPGEESMRNHPTWIVKCKLKNLRATWSYALNILLIYGLYSSYRQQIGSYQYGADGFKNLGSKTIGTSIQSFFKISVRNTGTKGLKCSSNDNSTLQADKNSNPNPSLRNSPSTNTNTSITNKYFTFNT